MKSVSKIIARLNRKPPRLVEESFAPLEQKIEFFFPRGVEPGLAISKEIDWSKSQHFDT